MRATSPGKLHQTIAAGNSVCLLDVRTAAEYASGHIAQAMLKPLERFDADRFAKEHSSPADEIHVICQSGTRARRAIKQLETAGLYNCVLVEGGMAAWVKAGFEVERQGKAVMSLERQVRIAAGVFVLCGTLLGAFVHPAFLLVSGMAGAGLVFAGISDICGMGMLLAKMPWNQVRTAAHDSLCCEAKS